MISVLLRHLVLIVVNSSSLAMDSVAIALGVVLTCGVL